MTCCGALATCTTRITAGSVLLVGLVVFTYGLVMMGTEVNGLSIFVTSFGAYTALVGATGVTLSCMTTGRKFTYVFVVLLSIALIAEVFGGVALKADKEWAEKFFLGETCGTLNSTNCGQQVQDAERFFDKHQNMVFFSLCGVAAVQCFAGIFACCFKSTHSDYDKLAQTGEDALLQQLNDGVDVEDQRRYERPARVARSPDNSGSAAAKLQQTLREKYGSGKYHNMAGPGEYGRGSTASNNSDYRY